MKHIVINNNIILTSYNLFWLMGSMNPSKSFRDLLVWERAHQFVLLIYRFTGAFPNCEHYCFVPQMRRAAISIPANIAEGFKKRGKSDKTRFLNTCAGFPRRITLLPHSQPRSWLRSHPQA
jgi:23S rRNA-intervening sequence protein